MLGALGSSGGAGGEQDDLALAAGTSRLLAGVPADELLERQAGVGAVGPGKDPSHVLVVGQRAVDGGGELLVVDDGVGTFAFDYLRQRGRGE